MELTPDLHAQLCPPYPVLPWFSWSLNGVVTLPRDLRCCHQTGGATGPGAGTGRELICAPLLAFVTSYLNLNLQ